MCPVQTVTHVSGRSVLSFNEAPIFSRKARETPFQLYYGVAECQALSVLFI